MRDGYCVMGDFVVYYLAKCPLDNLYGQGKGKNKINSRIKQVKI